jgi:choline dehydrogenase-like flavoprotein
MQLSLTVLALAVQAASSLNIFESGDSFGIPGKNASYDYVIVGGGTGGLTIAARLAEDKNASVAVIEAGGFYQIDNGNGRSVMMDSNCSSTCILSPLQCHPWSLRQSRCSSSARKLSTSDRLGLCHDIPAWLRKSQHPLCPRKDSRWLQRTQFHVVAQRNQWLLRQVGERGRR